MKTSLNNSVLLPILMLIAIITALPFEASASSHQLQCELVIDDAEFTHPTKRYPHAVLGDDVEYGAIQVKFRVDDGCKVEADTTEVRLPDTMVFEDLRPRLLDITGDELPEVVVVESSITEGARLAIWGVGEGKFKRLAATPFIGTAYRWLAPIGAADFDKDGFIELAYVDRPHLARVLRLWRYREGTLEPVAERAGLTNHRIGQDFISGGIRDCGSGVELITANANWSQVIATKLIDGALSSAPIGNYKDKSSFNAALSCNH